MTYNLWWPIGMDGEGQSKEWVMSAHLNDDDDDDDDDESVCKKNKLIINT